MVSTDIWFGVIVLIIMILIIALAIANVFYFNEIRNNKTVSNTAAIVMMSLNILLVLLALVLFIWAIVKVVEIASSGDHVHWVPHIHHEGEKTITVKSTPQKEYVLSETTPVITQNLPVTTTRTVYH